MGISPFLVTPVHIGRQLSTQEKKTHSSLFSLTLAVLRIKLSTRPTSEAVRVLRSLYNVVKKKSEPRFNNDKYSPRKTVFLALLGTQKTGQAGPAFPHRYKELELRGTPSSG